MVFESLRWYLSLFVDLLWYLSLLPLNKFVLKSLITTSVAVLIFTVALAFRVRASNTETLAGILCDLSFYLVFSRRFERGEIFPVLRNPFSTRLWDSLHNKSAETFNRHSMNTTLFPVLLCSPFVF
jgi:hypothetical protein